jgi:hypothetical protein
VLQERPVTVDPPGMRVSIVVYGVLYVVLEMVGHALQSVGWARVTGLDVATAVTDALLTVAVCCAVVLAAQLGWRRWGPALRAWQQARSGEGEWDDEPIGVASWRPEPLALPAPPAPAPAKPAGTYAPNPYSQFRHRFPEEPGQLL